MRRNGEPRLAMDRLRRYVCAFTDMLDMESTTEECDGSVPAPTPDTKVPEREAAARLGRWGAAAPTLGSGWEGHELGPAAATPQTVADGAHRPVIGDAL